MGSASQNQVIGAVEQIFMPERRFRSVQAMGDPYDLHFRPFL
jgi:hypothetical protein